MPGELVPGDSAELERRARQRSTAVSIRVGLPREVLLRLGLAAHQLPGSALRRAG